MPILLLVGGCGFLNEVVNDLSCCLMGLTPPPNEESILLTFASLPPAV